VFGASGRGKDFGQKVQESEVQILCTLYVDRHIRPFETIPEMRRGIKESDGGGEFKYNIFHIL
jgi:hypothetical protein